MWEQARSWWLRVVRNEYPDRLDWAAAECAVNRQRRAQIEAGMFPPGPWFPDVCPKDKFFVRTIDGDLGEVDRVTGVLTVTYQPPRGVGQMPLQGKTTMFARGVAALFCLLSATNVLGRCFGPGRDASLGWIDLRAFPTAAAIAIELAAVLAFGCLAAGARPREVRLRRGVTATFASMAAVAVGNVVSFYRVAGTGDVVPAIRLPLSLLVAALMAWFAVRAWPPGYADAEPVRRPPRARQGCLTFAAGFAAAAVVLPLAQMAFFGTTDYRRPADAVVVFGAGVHADGSPSLALSDRVETACGLYHEHRASLLVMSGGPGPGGVHETDAMRRIALARGVPDAAIVLDRGGLTTGTTVRNTAALFDALGVRRVLAVSHAYHLPRVKLTYQQAGRDVYTVPAEETRQLAGLPKFVAREVVALWVYYARGLVAT